jgi:hypothetical protein
MIRIDTRGIDSAVKGLEYLRKEKMPLATAKALNDTAWLIRERVMETMKGVFDRPTPFTLKSFWVHKASKRNLVARVDFEWSRLGYMKTQVEGGLRGRKRSEIALQKAGIMRHGQFWVPGKGARLNQYGNISGGQITQLLSVLGAAEMSSGYSANLTARSARRNRKPRDYFAVTKKQGGLLPGIYERIQSKAGFGAKTKKRLPFGVYQKGKSVGNFSSVVRARGVKAVLIFVNKAGYRKRLPFYEIGQKVVDRNFRRIFYETAQAAIHSWR